MLTPAFVLHHRRFKNTSLLCDVFTPDEGRFAVVARGAAESKRGLAGLLQPFQPLLLSWSGRGDVKTLSKVESAGKPVKLSGNRLYCGFYLNELLVKLTHQHDAFPELFAYYSHSLERLSSNEAMDVVLRQFEFNLLDQLGHGMNLQTEVDSALAVIADKWYFYDVERGLVETGEQNNEKISGLALLQMKNNQTLTDQSRAEFRQLMRRVISFYLGNKELKSRELFNQENYHVRS